MEFSKGNPEKVFSKTKLLPVCNTRQVNILECSPFKDKMSWQSDFISPVIEDALLHTHQKEKTVPPKKLDNIVRVKPTINATLYQDEYTEKGIPIKGRFVLQKQHLVFKGSMMTSSIYDNEYQKKNFERPDYCKQANTNVICQDNSFNGKIKSTYTEDFPVSLPKRLFCLPSLPKDNTRNRYVDPASQKFETETTYSKDYIPLDLEKSGRQAKSQVAAQGIIPRLSCVRPDPNTKKSVTAEELTRVAERFPKMCRPRSHPNSDSILKFDGKIYLDTLYASNNYADPGSKRWFIGHRLEWKAPPIQMKPRKHPTTAKVVGKPLTWRYV